MNWLALIPIAIKYGPLFYHFAETEGPGVQAFLKEIWGSFLAARNSDGSINWLSLLPLLFKYGTPVEKFLQKHGGDVAQMQHLIADVQSALKGAPITAPAPVIPAALIPSPVLSGPNFVFPAQPAPTPVGSFTS